MADHSRLEDLRRRVQKDPASIAFAQLAEECRRAGEYQEAVDVCRAGLEVHPGYLSARVTLGRSLAELHQFDEAEAQLTRVLAGAPDNLAAIRGLAEIYHRRGDLAQALARYRAAFALAPNDPDLERTVSDLAKKVEPPKPAPAGLSLEQVTGELLKLAPPPRVPPDVPHTPPRVQTIETAPSTAIAEPPGRSAAPMDLPVIADPAGSAIDVVPSTSDTPATDQQSSPPAPAAAPTDLPVTADPAGSAIDVAPPASDTLATDQQSPQAARTTEEPALSAVSADSAGDDAERAMRTVAALEQWLAVIHVARAQQHT